MKNRTGFIACIIGISLVLFLAGLASGIIVYINNLSEEYREELLVEVVLKEPMSNDQISQLQKRLSEKEFTRDVSYVSKEEAAKLLSQDLGENFMDVLGYNPLYPSLHLHLKNEFLQGEHLTTIKKQILSLDGISEVNVQENVLQHLEKKIKNTTLIILLFAALLLIFSVILIFNTIRLAMYSGRQTIYSMLLIGATRWFVMKPFLGNSIAHGMLAALLAIMMLVGTAFYIQYQFPDAGIQLLLPKFGIIAIALLIFGVLISLLSTWIALTKYLRFKQEII